MLEHAIDNMALRLQLEKVPINHWSKVVFAYRDSDGGYLIVFPKDRESELTGAILEYHLHFFELDIKITEEFDYHDDRTTFIELVKEMQHKARLCKIAVLEHKNHKKDDTENE